MIVLLTAWQGDAYAQQPLTMTDGPVTLSIEIDRREALVAEPISLAFNIAAPQQTSVSFPPISDTLGPVSVIDSSRLEELPIDGQPEMRRWIQQLTLESLETGTLTIPSLTFRYRLPETLGSREGSLRSGPIEIEIESVLSDQESPAEFRDIKAYEPLPAEDARDSKLLATALVIAIVTSLAVFAAWLWMRPRRGPSPDRWALDEIEAIKSQYDQQAIDIGQVYARLSSVIRAFLEAQLAIPATAQSTGELFEELPTDRFPDSARQRLRQFMTEADKFRFSGSARPGDGDRKLPFDSIQTVIRELVACDSSQRDSKQRRPR